MAVEGEIGDGMDVGSGTERGVRVRRHGLAGVLPSSGVSLRVEKSIRKILVFLSFMMVSCAGWADNGGTPDLSTRVDHYYLTYKINPDGTDVQTCEWGLKILKQGAVADAKQASMTYSASTEKLDITAAYTLKADGQRVNAPKDNFQLEVEKGKGSDAPVFSDLATLTVVFPDVAVGDTVVLAYKLTDIKPMFPGQFSVMETFPNTVAEDDVRIRIDAPASLWYQFHAHGMKEMLTEKDGRKIIDLSYRNAHPVRGIPQDYAIYDSDRLAGYAFSTFKSYKDIAEAYGSRALPKAAVTGRIKTLADAVVKNAKTPREQAKALFDWVATNISYAGNCIGVGAVVPHDTGFILDNRMGDCKDHATLLQALLAAEGIASTQALINAGNIYNLPKIPVVSTVNHVINYLPGLGIYADSTSPDTPFGMLPFADADKPVLLVQGYAADSKTPPLAAAGNWQHLSSVVDIHPDASATVSVNVDLHGIYAVSARAGLRHVTREQEENWVKSTIRNDGYLGSGSVVKESPSALLNTYHYQANLKLDDFVDRPGAGAFHLYPLFATEAPVYSFVSVATKPAAKVDTECLGGSSTEEYTYRFPQGMKILYVPGDMAVGNRYLTYRATYRLKGNVLKVTRELDDKTAGNICTPARAEAYRHLALAILHNVKEQVLYRYP